MYCLDGHDHKVLNDLWHERPVGGADLLTLKRRMGGNDIRDEALVEALDGAKEDKAVLVVQIG